MMVDTAELPYEVRQYISKEWQNIGEANACDFKSTYQPELDRAKERIVTMWNNGLTFVIAPDDERRMRALYKLKKGAYGSEHLVEERIDKVWVLVPAWKALLPEYRQLFEIFPVFKCAQACPDCGAPKCESHRNRCREISGY